MSDPFIKLSIEDAIALRGDLPNFMSDQEHLDDLIHEAGGPSIYPRCPEDGRRCVYSTVDEAEVRERNERYRAVGLPEAFMCCRGGVKG